MIGFQKDFAALLQPGHLAWFVFASSEAFFFQGSVAAFDMRLFIFLVRSRDAVTVTK